ncbi:MAG: hypothetical protein E7142_06955 [Rikenellaceae bacterium]|nr:hypothetical protein [Rikenellaceae bacterium]
MKKLFLFIVLPTLMVACGVKKSEYNKILAQRDSLLLTVDSLVNENEELKNGEERLMNYIKLYNENKDYIRALEKLNKLKKYHKESPIFAEHKNLFSEIERKAQIMTDSIAKAKRDSIKLASINELGQWHIGDFVNDFDEPTGKHFVYSEFYGTFSNSATASSKLRVYVQFLHYAFSDPYDFSVKFLFDEYDDGTYEKEECTSIKVVNKELRKVYKEYSASRYDYLVDSNGEAYSTKGILSEEGVYEFEMRFKYGTVYRFNVDTKYINNALVKAGLKRIEDL